MRVVRYGQNPGINLPFPYIGNPSKRDPEKILSHQGLISTYAGLGDIAILLAALDLPK